eukprot:TRINITY_DN14034_c0_g1_i2.p2 TRINITY_DN14034_c0_g1~~TRINITY_DN14034_c0_g1_i2.p2  ORF type:complete len:173 (-),score=27.22 TRINITY_DN14034_c0_g1_i2:422-940(-)
MQEAGALKLGDLGKDGKFSREDLLLFRQPEKCKALSSRQAGFVLPKPGWLKTASLEETSDPEKLAALAARCKELDPETAPFVPQAKMTKQNGLDPQSMPFVPLSVVAAQMVKTMPQFADTQPMLNDTFAGAEAWTSWGQTQNTVFVPQQMWIPTSGMWTNHRPYRGKVFKKM